MTLRALVADDEPLARQRLRRLLSAHPDLELVGEAADGQSALEQTLALRPDLIFLDVNMPLLDGLACLERLHALLAEGQRPLAVFTTAYEEHALRAIELEGLDYLVKPVEEAALARALRRARRAHGGGAQSAKKVTPVRLPAHKGKSIVNLLLSQVAAITLEDTITYAHTLTGRYRVRAGLGALERQLPSPPWVRVSRAALVNLNWVERIEPLFSGKYLALLRAPVGGEIAVSRRRAVRLKQMLGL